MRPTAKAGNGSTESLDALPVGPGARHFHRAGFTLAAEAGMVDGHSHLQEKHMRKIILAIGLGTALSACGNWVNLTAAGRLVTVATPAEVAGCRRVGTSNASALSEIVFVERGSAKLQAELIDLARNEAADMGGNRIVVESPITDGRQTFGVYSCLN
jgi:hypothetical protein